jgi:hypothetical protein
MAEEQSAGAGTRFLATQADPEGIGSKVGTHLPVQARAPAPRRRRAMPRHDSMESVERFSECARYHERTL